MPDGSDTPSAMSVQTDGALVDGIRSFVTGHAGAKAVIEYVGRRGARIVLVAEDGAWVDQFADSTEVARLACQQAGVQIENEWERELTELMRPSNDLWRSMSRRSLAR